MSRYAHALYSHDLLSREKATKNHYLGHVMAPGLAFVGIISTAMWLLINHTGNYYKQYHEPAIVYAILAIGCIIIALQWHRKMYLQYKALNA
ncbi:MAG: hypothetical protein H6550_12660 [Chitinophagales bacterium]|nr:hypothetical protein [Chitinophagales bacterium]